MANEKAFDTNSNCPTFNISMYQSLCEKLYCFLLASFKVVFADEAPAELA
jgi:hypothetical protein